MKLNEISARLNANTQQEMNYSHPGHLAYLREKYCFWDIPNCSEYVISLDSSYHKEEAEGLQSVGVRAYCYPLQHSIDIYNARVSNVKKSRENIEMLKHYNCSVEERKNERGGITTFFIWNYKGCNKEFSRTWSILDHVRMHEGIRPYQCPHCSRTYTQKGNMIKHMRRHIEPDIDTRRQYICEYCQRGYTEKYNLKVHTVDLDRLDQAYSISFESKC